VPFRHDRDRGRAEGGGHGLQAGEAPVQRRSACADNDIEGSVKIRSDATADRLLGAHVIGSRAGSMIAQIARAFELVAPAEDVGRACHAHPTFNDDQGRALAANGVARNI
jgi:dihydrolipoamide dehydrogenase